MNGYILESRSILDSEIWKKPPLYLKVWQYLLLKAQYEPYRDLDRGQLFTSIDEIREACTYYVGYRKETPSRAEIFRILDWLRKSHEGEREGNNEANMITTTKVTGGMVVTIVNYGIYQDPAFYERNTESTTNATAKDVRTKSDANNIKGRREKKNKKNVISRTRARVRSAYHNTGPTEDINELERLLQETN